MPPRCSTRKPTGKPSWTTSSRSARKAALEKEGNGLFTRAMLDALGHAAGVPYNRSNQLFYTHHLHTFVFDQVSERSNGRQHPFLSLPWVVQSFPVAKFPANK